MGTNVIQDFLSKLTAGKKPDVFLSVTPGIGLEMIQVDYPSHTVSNYGVRPLAYNEALREISNMEEFKTSVSELFDELQINPKCNITLNLPNVLFGSLDMSLMVGDEAVTGAVTSEVEQSYVFKRHDPMVKWWDSNIGSGETRKLFYSAVQQLVVENITNALAELGATLIGVEMSIVSTLRALNYTGLSGDQMSGETAWNLLTVNSNGYTLLSMKGQQIVDFYEEPIAVKSYEGDEIYNVISSSAQITLMSYPVNHMLVISDTDAISAEILAKNLNVDYSIEYVENNKYKNKAFLPNSLTVLPDYETKVSLQAIGVAVSKSSDYPINCNFLSTSDSDSVAVDDSVFLPIGEGVTITPIQAIVYALVFALLVVGVPAVISTLILPNMVSEKQSMVDSLNEDIKKENDKIKELEEQDQMQGMFNAKAEISRVLENNRLKLMSYVAIGEAVPADLWLTEFRVDENAKITIKGGSSTVEDVYTFFKNMKESLVNSNLQIQSLKMISDNVDEFMQNLPVTYEFEIGNGASSAPAAAAADAVDKIKGAAADAAKSKGKTTGQAANVPPDKKLLSDKPIN